MSPCLSALRPRHVWSDADREELFSGPESSELGHRLDGAGRARSPRPLIPTGRIVFRVLPPTASHSALIALSCHFAFRLILSLIAKFW